MSRPRSTPPPIDPPELIEPSDESTITIPTEWGLSNAQVKELLVAMRGMIRKVGCPVHLHLDVVQDAFVVALSKPISERVSVTEWKRFVSWMCSLAKYSALTNRNTERRRREVSDEKITERLAVLAPDKDFLALDALEKARLQLAPKHQAIIKAHYFEGKSIQQLADEQDVAWSTMKSRVDRVHDLLRMALRSLLAAILLLFPKDTRARSVRLARHVSRLVPQATPTACAMMVSLVCGVMVPSVSIGTMEPQGSTAILLSALPSAKVAAVMEPAEPPLALEVEPVKPIAIDELEKQWSAADMKATTIVSYLQATMLPFAFLVTPAVMQVACAGAEHHTPPPQEPEEEPDWGGADPYDRMCDNEHRRGDECPSRADWCASMGMRPAPRGCK